MDLMPPNPMLQ